jgi:hypothetical protein
MRRKRLIAAFVVLLALNVRAVVELWEHIHVDRRSTSAVEQLAGSGTLSAASWTLVILFDLGVLYLTIRVGRRLRQPEQRTPSS